MQVRQLRYFVEVAMTENFSQAAKKLNVVQSAVSRQVRELELDLGCDLFDRFGKRVRLSAFGAQFLIQAQRILAEIDQAYGQARMAACGQTGLLRVALQIAAFDRPLVRNSVRQFKLEHPDVELVLLPMKGEQVLESVRGGAVDGGFAYAPLAYPDVVFELLTQEEWLLTMPKTHRLAAAPAIRLADLAEEPFIWIPREASPILHDRMLAACHNGGLVPNIVQRASDRLLLLGLIEAGIGLCFLPGPIGIERSKEILQRSVTDFSLPVDAGFVWKRGTRSMPRQRLVDTIRRLKTEIATPE
jgi:DNA-binding transcriptional LysR family regulator